MPQRRGSPIRPTKALPVYQKRKVPTRHILTSLLFGSPIPRRRVFITTGLVREQWRIGRVRVPDKLSNLEGEVVSRGIAGAERIRDQGAAKLSQLIEQASSTRAQGAALQAEADRLDDYPVTGVDGQLLTAHAAAERMNSLVALIAAATNAGSLKHRRVSRVLVKLAPFATVLDLPILLWFVGSVFNVDWTNLAAGQGVIQFLTSLVFAILGTAAVAMGLNYFGRDLKAIRMMMVT